MIIAYVPGTMQAIRLDEDEYDEEEAARNAALMNHGGFIDVWLEVEDKILFVPGWSL